MQPAAVPPLFQALPWLALVSALAACAGATTLAVAGPVSWLALAVASLAAGVITAGLLERSVLQPVRRLSVARREAEAALAGRIELQRRIRHDMRGALSPALLLADRLLNHADPAVKRTGDIVVRSIERAASLIEESDEAAAAPPGG